MLFKFWKFPLQQPRNMVLRRYSWGVLHYGEKIDKGRASRLKKNIKFRLGIKPRVRYKLTTHHTQYCGYVFTEWK